MPAPTFEELLARPTLAWMGQNTTHLEPPAAVVAAMTASVASREFQLYAPPLGFERLRELILEDLGLAEADAWVTDGAVGGLYHLCTVLAPEISQLITSDPGWPWPGRFVGIGGRPLTVLDVYDQPGAKLSAAQIAEVIEPRSLIYLIDPLNPLGSLYSRSELEAIVALARETESYIVHDCTYRHFAEGHSLVAELYPERTFTTYSFSKWLGLAGLRLGAVVAAPELLTRLTTVPANPLGAPILAQRAAIAGLEGRGPWLQMLREVNRRNIAAVERVVADTGFGSVVVSPSQANFLAVDVSATGLHSEEVCARVLAQDVFIRPGTYQSPHFGARFVKISTSVPEHWVDRFSEAWTALAQEAAR
ncbi:pyridoxal phosphate-dependent aminotransferase [Demequina capsici]|uniref:Aminotransferase n=1 Tax=Demequina capsici TaxID=3075620 RepID=A0AA96F4U2_9MICO|nr:pyridoxal phosphate-dependent aminotransferase [Demequina sp. OYTSA14]WNM24081.1 pyridoxal phosphate-dependent aminotransferase [Demequina sp. OYTSA14]